MPSESLPTPRRLLADLSIQNKVILGSVLIALLVAAVCGYTFSGISLIASANRDFTAALEKTRPLQQQSEAVSAALSQLTSARVDFDARLRDLADAVVANRPIATLFPDDAEDPFAPLLKQGDALFDPQIIPNAGNERAELAASTEALRSLDTALRSAWQARNDKLTRKLTDLKNSLIYWNLKVVNLVFIRSSIGELVYEEIDDTPIAWFFASDLAAEAAAHDPGFAEIQARLLEQNEQLYATTLKLNRLMLVGEWEQVRLLYRDNFPTAIKSMAVDLDQLLTFVNAALIAQKGAIQLIEEEINPVATRIDTQLQRLATTLQERVENGRHEIDAGMRQADEKRTRMAGRIDTLRSANLLLPWLILLLIVIGGRTFSRLVSSPLRRISRRMSEIADGAGDLSRALPVLSRDEIGQLSTNFNRFLAHQRRLISDVAETTGELHSATGSLSHASKEVDGSSLTQSDQLERSVGTVRKVASESQRVSDHTESLLDATRQCSSATMELKATIEEIAEQMEGLLQEAIAVSSSSQQMSAASQQIRANLDNLVTMMAKTADAVELFESKTAAINRLAQQSGDSAKQAADDAKRGRSAVESSLRGVATLHETIDKANAIISEVGDESRQIDRILGVINDVSDQTSLLALNATIIAAQAGEHGQGFAVVANEVRELAVRTASSTQEIAGIVEGFQQKTADAVAIIDTGRREADAVVGQSGEVQVALEQILASTGSSEEQAFEIVEASTEQASQSKRLRASVDEVHAMLEQIAGAITQLGAGIDHSAKISEGMRDIAQRVKGSTEEQTAGTRQIAENMESVRDVTDQIHAALKEQAHGTAALLDELALVLQGAQGNRGEAQRMEQIVTALGEKIEQLRQGVGVFRLT